MLISKDTLVDTHKILYARNGSISLQPVHEVLSINAHLTHDLINQLTCMFFLVNIAPAESLSSSHISDM